jgi:hypothetical protein
MASIYMAGCLRAHDRSCAKQEAPHLQRRLHQKPSKTFASLFWLIMDVRLVALIQGKLLIRIARGLQGDL